MSEEQENIATFEDILKVFRKFLYMQNEDFIRLTVAVILGNQMPDRRPIWLMLVAPPSSGKTTTLNALQGLVITTKEGNKIQPVHDISDLTENSFASGMVRNDSETSLLKKIPFGGVMSFKDFTSVLSKQQQSKIAIMAQLREIYDGSYVKRTGNGNDVRWVGKIGAIAGVTQAVYQHLSTMSVMGDRFMLYQIPQPNRKEMLKFKIEQERKNETENDMMPIARDMMHNYMQRAFDNMRETKVHIPSADEDEIIEVADFCTMVRSGIITDDYSGEIKFVPEPEMPARMFDQMMALASALIFMRQLDGEESDRMKKEDYSLIYKIAYDSIPITRRIALNYLATYKGGVTTAALAAKINYPTKVVAQWLEQLNALGVVKRIVTGGRGNTWQLKPEYSSLMQRLQNVKVLDETLVADEYTDDEVDKFWEQDRQGGVFFDEFEVREMDENGTF